MWVVRGLYVGCTAVACGLYGGWPVSAVAAALAASFPLKRSPMRTGLRGPRMCSTKGWRGAAVI